MEFGATWDQAVDTLSEKLQDAIKFVIADRSKDYDDPEGKKLKPEDVGLIIDKCIATNAAASFGANLIPGPFGIAVSIPEIVFVMRNNVAMIYDIGIAHGKRAQLNEQLLIKVLVSSLGSASGRLIIASGSKYVIKRVSLHYMQSVIRILGGKVLQQTLKSTISKFLPGIGSVAMALWAAQTTYSIGKYTDDVFGKTIEESDIDEKVEEQDTPEEAGEETHVDEEIITASEGKLQILAWLIIADGVVDEREKEKMEDFLSNAPVSDGAKERLRKETAIPADVEERVKNLNMDKDSCMALLRDMVAVSLCDDNLADSEVAFIYRVAAAMGLDKDVVRDTIRTAQKLDLSGYGAEEDYDERDVGDHPDFDEIFDGVSQKQRSGLWKSLRGIIIGGEFKRYTVIERKDYRSAIKLTLLGEWPALASSVLSAEHRIGNERMAMKLMIDNLFDFVRRGSQPSQTSTTFINSILEE